MKLEEKLMKLRKENAWSQEELADKLNVSRQTVSKWELGQTTPDIDNLTKIASIFGVSVSDLLDENANPTEEKYRANKNNGRLIKILILVAILILVFLGIGAITINKIFNKVTNQVVPKSIAEMFEQYSISDIFDTVFGKIQESENEIQESRRNFDRDLFNSNFKNLYYGSTTGFFMNNFVDEVIKSNEEHPNNLITVKYKELEAKSSDDLRTLKKQLKSGVNDKYEIYYEYDENGYINKAIIEDVKSEENNGNNVINEKNMDDAINNVMQMQQKMMEQMNH